MKAVLPIALVLFVGGVVLAQEHPEHPKNTSKDTKQHAYTMDELEKAITAEIQTAQKKDGAYHIRDEKANKTWDLKLDHVHKERLARVDPTTYFACTDFKSADNHTVDVDFFMKDDGKQLVLSDATLHKVDGQPRYNWQEKDGYWVRVPVE
jgi:hypothetical protein